VLKNEAFRQSEKLEEAGKQEAQHILDAALDEIKTHHETAVAERRARVKRLRQELQNETETLVAAILESLLGRRTDS
jgi:F0F1-type ATP synthase membrane subunit b/b'